MTENLEEQAREFIGIMYTQSKKKALEYLSYHGNDLLNYLKKHPDYAIQLKEARMQF